MTTRVRFSFNDLPPLNSTDFSVDLSALVAKTESLLYTLADAAVAADPAAAEATSGTVQKAGGWFGFIAEAMEVVLKVTKISIFVTSILYFIV